ncbi:MAG: protein O-mannosyl-transferase family [Nitrososphaerales archaeon]
MLVFAALYLYTLDDGLRPGELQGGDLITHQYAQVQGRFSNAPGYPLYTMGGWLWYHGARLLLGPGANPIRILSSYSTLWALISLALLYALCLLVTRDHDRPAGNWPLALVVAAFYGLTYFFWYYAVTTEQYTSSVAWTLAVVFLAFRWEEARRDAHLLGLALLVGIGLAHQVTVLAILPPLLWFVLSGEPRLLRRGRLVLGAILLTLLPHLSYIFVYVRGAQHPEWRGAGEWATTWQWFLSFVSTRQGRGELTWSWRPFLTPEFPALTWRELTWPGLLAGLVGIAALGRRRTTLLYATTIIYLVFSWIDRLGNWYQVIMPVYALLALGIAAGADWLVRRASRRWVSAGVLALLVALAAYRGSTSYPKADQSGHPDDLALAPGWQILADTPPQETPILATQGEAVSLNYLTEIWGERPDLKAVDSHTAKNLLSHDLVAVTRSALPIVPAEVDPSARYGALGPTLAWIRRQPSTEIPPNLLPWNHTFGDQLQLLGGRIERNSLGEQVVRLAWQALRVPSHDWSVSVRLGSGDQPIGQQDVPAPVNGAYPTSRWTPGEIVTDAYAFKLPAGAAPDQLTVILYRQGENGDFINLDVARFPLPWIE